MEQAKSVHLCLQGSKRKGSLQKSLHSLQSKRSGFSSSKLRLTEGALPETGRRPGIAACSQSTHSEVSDAPWVCSEGESQLAVTCSGRSGCGAGSRPKGRWNELLRSARLCIAANAAVPSVPCSPSLGYCGNLVLSGGVPESFCPPSWIKGGRGRGVGMRTTGSAPRESLAAMRSPRSHALHAWCTGASSSISIADYVATGAMPTSRQSPPARKL